MAGKDDKADAKQETTVAKSAPVGDKYQLIAGIHIDEQGMHEAGNPENMFVHSTTDLAAKHGADKFVKVA